MIPYYQILTFHLGPIPIQAWGTMVALGILVGLWVVLHRAKRLALDTRIIMDAATWSLVGAFVGARIVTVLFYDFSFYVAHPWDVFAIWNGGFSSVGGFLGAAIVGVWFLRRRGVDVWRYADTMIFGLPIGLGIGRIGCFLIHDHPGTASDLFLAVQYPDGESRLDHGLLLSINGFIMAIVFALLAQKKRPTGTYVAVFMIWYGIVRFWLDFYRITDATYFGLTPAQYVSAVMVMAGIVFAVRMGQHARSGRALPGKRQTGPWCG